MKRSKILIIVIVFLFLVFVVLAVYNLFLKDGRPAPTSLEGFFASPEELSNGNSVDGFQDKTLVRIAPEIVAFDTAADNDLVTVSGQGLFRRYDNTDLSLKILHPLGLTILRSEISGSTERVLVFSIEGGVGGWSVFSLADQRLESLSASVNDAAFSPQGQIAIVEEDDKGSRVVIKNGGEGRTVFSGNIPDLEASWVNERTLALTTRPSGTAPGILYLLDTNTKRLTRLAGNRYGLTALVSPDGERAVFGETGADGKGLIVKSFETANLQERPLGLNTLPEKCVFSSSASNVVYCAAFSVDPRTAAMPDDYRKDVFSNLRSDIVRLNLETGESAVLHQNLPVDPVSLRLSSDERYLFFINKTDGGLYRLEL